ncbi:MAG: multicomponent K+:H+ antiporter subunit PhaD [Rhodobacteraceae bacterium HLUCCA12]|nr:MAG: multicomponent K+:H+ antiporter subunit PhaD [Rhodobacteraceae bacterium HLUCCA12]
MLHWIVAPIVLPALVAPIIALAMRHDLVLQRVFSLASTSALVLIAAALFQAAATGAVESYEIGSWPAPFGIVLVLDRLSALMVTLTAVLALVVLAYAVASGWDARGRHFHALYQFQLMGLFGAMLTGDIFNLFVFFEILLIASYGLMIHGGGRMRLRGGVQYVVFNLAGSTLFLFALGTIYGVMGTLNMADMAVRAAELPPGDSGLLRVAAALLLLVFVLKGAVLPLHFWLPNTYALAPAPVAALFAVMTKVGAYSVIRVYTLVFHPELEATGTMIADILIPAALLTLAVGMIGVLAGGTLARVVAFAAIGSMGTLFLAIGAFTPQATAAAVYYLVHSTLAAAALFLIVDQIRARLGSSALVAQPPMASGGLVAALFFGAAIAMAGMPPLSGFVGKLLVMDALRAHPLWIWIWATILITSLISVVGFARAGSTLFWMAHDAGTPMPPPDAEARVNRIEDQVHPGAALASIGAMLGLIVALTVLAGPMMRQAEATAAQLHDRQAYIEAVLGPAPTANPNPQAADEER